MPQQNIFDLRQGSNSGSMLDVLRKIREEEEKKASKNNQIIKEEKEAKKASKPSVFDNIKARRKKTKKSGAVVTPKKEREIKRPFKSKYQVPKLKEKELFSFDDSRAFTKSGGKFPKDKTTSVFDTALTSRFPIDPSKEEERTGLGRYASKFARSALTTGAGGIDFLDAITGNPVASDEDFLRRAYKLEGKILPPALAAKFYEDARNPEKSNPNDGPLTSRARELIASSPFLRPRGKSETTDDTRATLEKMRDPDWYISGFVESMPHMMAVTAGALLGGPVGAFATSAALEGGGIYTDALDAGMPKDIAKDIALGAAPVVAAIDRIVPGRAAKRIAGAVGGKTVKQALKKPLKKLIKKDLTSVLIHYGWKAFTGGTTEFLTEGAQEAFIGKAEQHGWNPSLKNEDIIKRSLEAGILAIAPGGSMETSTQMFADVYNEFKRPGSVFDPESGSKLAEGIGGLGAGRRGSLSFRPSRRQTLSKSAKEFFTKTKGDFDLIAKEIANEGSQSPKMFELVKSLKEILGDDVTSRLTENLKKAKTTEEIDQGEKSVIAAVQYAWAQFKQQNEVEAGEIALDNLEAPKATTGEPKQKSDTFTKTKESKGFLYDQDVELLKSTPEGEPVNSSYWPVEGTPERAEADAKAVEQAKKLKEGDVLEAASGGFYVIKGGLIWTFNEDTGKLGDIAGQIYKGSRDGKVLDVDLNARNIVARSKKVGTVAKKKAKVSKGVFTGVTREVAEAFINKETPARLFAQYKNDPNVTIDRTPNGGVRITPQEGQFKYGEGLTNHEGIRFTFAKAYKNQKGSRQNQPVTIAVNKAGEAFAVYYVNTMGKQNKDTGARRGWILARLSGGTKTTKGSKGAASPDQTGTKDFSKDLMISTALSNEADGEILTIYDWEELRNFAKFHGVDIGTKLQRYGTGEAPDPSKVAALKRATKQKQAVREVEAASRAGKKVNVQANVQTERRAQKLTELREELKNDPTAAVRIFGEFGPKVTELLNDPKSKRLKADERVALGRLVHGELAKRLKQDKTEAEVAAANTAQRRKQRAEAIAAEKEARAEAVKEKQTKKDASEFSEFTPEEQERLNKLTAEEQAEFKRLTAEQKADEASEVVPDEVHSTEADESELVSEGAAKQPWEMTPDEYLDSVPRTTQGKLLDHHEGTLPILRTTAELNGKSVLDLIEKTTGKRPTTLFEVLQHYVDNKYKDLISAKVVLHLRTGSGSSYGMETQIQRLKSNNKVVRYDIVVNTDVLEANEVTFEQQVGELRHELEHILEASRGTGSQVEIGDRVYDELQKKYGSPSKYAKATGISEQQAHREFFKGHFGAWDAFDLEYTHKALVRDAIEAGENVPANVKALYPDLADVKVKKQTRKEQVAEAPERRRLDGKFETNVKNIDDLLRKKALNGFHWYDFTGNKLTIDDFNNAVEKWIKVASKLGKSVFRRSIDTDIGPVEDALFYDFRKLKQILTRNKVADFSKDTPKQARDKVTDFLKRSMDEVLAGNELDAINEAYGDQSLLEDPGKEVTKEERTDEEIQRAFDEANEDALEGEPQFADISEEERQRIREANQPTPEEEASGQVSRINDPLVYRWGNTPERQAVRGKVVEVLAKLGNKRRIKLPDGKVVIVPAGALIRQSKWNAQQDKKKQRELGKKLDKEAKALARADVKAAREAAKAAKIKAAAEVKHVEEATKQARKESEQKRVDEVVAARTDKALPASVSDAQAKGETVAEVNGKKVFVSPADAPSIFDDETKKKVAKPKKEKRAKKALEKKLDPTTEDREKLLRLTLDGYELITGKGGIETATPFTLEQALEVVAKNKDNQKLTKAKRRLWWNREFHIEELSNGGHYIFSSPADATTLEARAQARQDGEVTIPDVTTNSTKPLSVGPKALPGSTQELDEQIDRVLKEAQDAGVQIRRTSKSLWEKFKDYVMPAEDRMRQFGTGGVVIAQKTLLLNDREWEISGEFRGKVNEATSAVKGKKLKELKKRAKKLPKKQRRELLESIKALSAKEKQAALGSIDKLFLREGSEKLLKLPRVKRAARGIAKAVQELFDRAVELGVQVRVYDHKTGESRLESIEKHHIENYLTHKLKPEIAALIKDNHAATIKRYADAVTKYFKEQKVIISDNDAINMLKRLAHEELSYVDYKPMTSKRLIPHPEELGLADWYVTDFDNVINNMGTEASKFLASSEIFGKWYEKVQDSLNSILEEKGESAFRFTMDVLRSLTSGDPANEVTRFFTKLSGLASNLYLSSPTSSFKNLLLAEGSLVSVFGYKQAMKATMHVLAHPNESYDQVLAAGAIDPGVRIMELSRIKRWNVSGFKQSETAARVISGIASVMHAQMLVDIGRDIDAPLWKKFWRQTGGRFVGGFGTPGYARRNLGAKFYNLDNVDALLKGERELNSDDYGRIMRQGTAHTQGVTNARTLPKIMRAALRNSQGEVILNSSPFSLFFRMAGRATVNVWKNGFGELVHGNPAPLIRFLSAAAGTGLARTSMYWMAFNREPEWIDDDLLSKTLHLMVMGELAGIFNNYFEYGNLKDAYMPVIIRLPKSAFTNLYQTVTGRKSITQGTWDTVSENVAISRHIFSLVETRMNKDRTLVTNLRKRMRYWMEKSGRIDEDALEVDPILTSRSPGYRLLKESFWSDDDKHFIAAWRTNLEVLSEGARRGIGPHQDWTPRQITTRLKSLVSKLGPLPSKRNTVRFKRFWESRNKETRKEYVAAEKRFRKRLSSKLRAINETTKEWETELKNYKSLGTERRELNFGPTPGSTGNVPNQVKRIKKRKRKEVKTWKQLARERGVEVK